ncbi:MAG: dual specificity protein phosphatase family protein [Cyanobacteria bacterium P01_G01_bin.19]
MSKTSISDNVWWLIPEKLAGMPRPQLEDLAELKEASIKGIVSVMDEPSGIKEYQEEGFQALWLPITGGKPPAVEQVKQFANFAEPIIESNRSVVVHCTSGNRRTGTLLAAYLIAKGETPQQAIALVQKARPTAELREAQQNFLFQLPELLAS